MIFSRMDLVSSKIYSTVTTIKGMAVLGMEKFSYIQKPWANGTLKVI